MLVAHSAGNYDLPTQPEDQVLGIQPVSDSDCGLKCPVLVVPLPYIALRRGEKRILPGFETLKDKPPVVSCRGLRLFRAFPDGYFCVRHRHASHRINDHAADAIRGRSLLLYNGRERSEQHSKAKQRRHHRCLSLGSWISTRTLVSSPDCRVTALACSMYFSIAAGFRNSRSSASFTAISWYLPGARFPS